MLFIYCAIQHAENWIIFKIDFIKHKKFNQRLWYQLLEIYANAEACEFNNELNIQFYPIKLTEKK